MTQTKFGWRPYKLSYREHAELIDHRARGATIAELAVRFDITVQTVYDYLNRDPGRRHDAPARLAEPGSY